MLLLEPEKRTEIWERVFEEIEAYTNQVAALPVAGKFSAEEIGDLLKPFDFAESVEPLALIDFAAKSMRNYHVHNAHPRYFGLFVPAPTTMGIAADALVAAVNPALGAWSISPIAVEIERHLINAFGARFGYNPSEIDGTFTTGGAEANHTAVLTALRHKFPEFAGKGLRGIDSQPVLYASSESHHSVKKAARLCGLGTESVRAIRIDEELRMDLNPLAARVAEDKANGCAPFLIVATAGTTSAGAIDPLQELAAFSRQERIWLHVDAAWGGAAMLVPELRGLLTGINLADSITFDVHKWLSVPMGAGMFLTRHPKILSQTFRVEAPYMPPEEDDLRTADPYTHSMQWSRRFIGLKVFLSLGAVGWSGYAEALRHQVEMGDYLRESLTTSDWEVVNKTALPLVCFVDSVHANGRESAYLNAIARHILASGGAWISTTSIGSDGTAVLRACITNYRTQAEDIDALISYLEEARRDQAGK